MINIPSPFSHFSPPSQEAARRRFATEVAAENARMIAERRLAQQQAVHMERQQAQQALHSQASPTQITRCTSLQNMTQSCHVVHRPIQAFTGIHLDVGHILGLVHVWVDVFTLCFVSPYLGQVLALQPNPKIEPCCAVGCCQCQRLSC